MNHDAHLSAAQLARYRDRTLAPGELLAADRHLAGCGECRSVLFGHLGAAPQLRGLRADFSEHLSYAQVVACAQGEGGPDAVEHLRHCAPCRDEVEDLGRFRQKVAAPRAPVEMRPPRAAWVAPAWASAAAAIAIAGVALWLSRGPASHPPPGPLAQQQPAAPAEPALTAAERAALAPLAAGRGFARAPVLDRIVTRRGVLLGAPAPARTFALAAPVGTAVTGDRPRFRWQRLDGASGYVVSVYDEDFHKVVESPAVTGTAWLPAAGLPRGRVYLWQVTARVGGESVRAPVPPAPEARFEVAPAAEAAAIEQARREHPGNHLLLAALLARSGALDEAAAELDSLAATDPARAQALRTSLSGIRR